MTDYTKLVKALRHCSHDGLVKCNECEYGGKEWPVVCEDEMMRDAASAIEALQSTIELMKPYMPDFFPDANKVTLPKMEVQDG